MADGSWKDAKKVNDDFMAILVGKENRPIVAIKHEEDSQLP
jgi:hypothetical protein